MASRFDEDFMRGYKHAPFFDKLCKKAYPLLGNVTQCALVEFSNSGNVLIAANRADVGEDALANKAYQHQTLWSFKDGLKREEFDAGYDGYYEKIGAFKAKNPLFYFSWRMAVDSVTQRVFFLCSDEPKIYAELISNLSLVKKLLRHFNSESDAIAKQCREHMIDISSVTPNYFVKFNPKQDTDLDRLNNLLQEINLLRGEKITTREWQCAMLYARGKSASQTGELLKISRRTVETHFANLKEKLGVEYKSEILEKLI